MKWESILSIVSFVLLMYLVFRDLQYLVRYELNSGTSVNAGAAINADSSATLSGFTQARVSGKAARKNADL